MTQLTFADTKIVFDVPDGTFTTWSNDKYFRVSQTEYRKPKSKNNHQNEDSGKMPGDMLGDYRSGKTYMIIEKDKVLMDMKPPMSFLNTSKHKSKKLNIEYKNKGKGKTIAGLSTIKYDIIVKGKKCFEVLLTKNKAFISAANKYNAINSDDDNNPEADSICEQAENQIESQKISKNGLSVKTTNANGVVEMVIKEFKTGVKAPKKYLGLPKGYKVMTMMEAMTKAMKDGSFNMQQ